MITIPIYFSIMIMQLVRRRNRSALASGVGSLIAVAHALVVEYLPLSNPIVFYSLMFLLAYGWHLLLDHLKLKLSAMISVGLVCLQVIMIFNAIGSSDVMNTALYQYYPAVIIMINLSMLLAAFGEKDDMAVINTHTDSKYKGSTKGEGTV